jgi:transposase InsO family protein
LHGEGHIVNHKKVMRLMKENGLSARPRRRFIATTDSDHDGPVFPNLAKNIVPTNLNQLWVADITYIAIASGFVYLAAILDAWSRRVVGYAIGKRIDARPALAGHGAEAVCEATMRTITTLPEQLRRSLTWDQGAEMAQHARLKIDAGVKVYFCDPHSPWQRATNENTNGLLRQYFPKGTDLSVHNADEIVAVEVALNTRPRKTLDWRTPAEALNELLRSANKQPIATTG